ncbi:hypothetical protein INR49_002012 [Caranx melampygus]|nr:hypothetical protein INR49_002012 [Caranx melampygus]
MQSEVGRMSISMTRADGVTVFTLTSDPQSSCPPLCQIFKSLCYSPVCCSVSERLRRVQRMSQSVLGALHIMVGLLNIGLGVILLCSHASWYQMDESAFPVWMGAMILKDLCYSPGCCTVYKGLMQTSIATALGTIQIMVGLFNIGLGPGRTSTHPGDLTGLGAAYWLAIFAITAIVLYGIDLADASLLWMCDGSTNSVDLYGDNCINVALFAQRLLRSMDITLIAAALLQLCVSIRFAILGISALTTEMMMKEVKLEVSAQTCTFGNSWVIN